MRCWISFNSPHGRLLRRRAIPYGSFLKLQVLWARGKLRIAEAISISKVGCPRWTSRRPRLAHARQIVGVEKDAAAQILAACKIEAALLHSFSGLARFTWSHAIFAVELPRTTPIANKTPHIRPLVRHTGLAPPRSRCGQTETGQNSPCSRRKVSQNVP